MQVGFGNLGGVLSSFTYTYKDAPNFSQGHAIVIGLLTLSTVLCFMMRRWCIAENTRRRLEDMHRGRERGWTRDQMLADSENGDLAGFFRYME